MSSLSFHLNINVPLFFSVIHDLDRMKKYNGMNGIMQLKSVITSAWSTEKESRISEENFKAYIWDERIRGTCLMYVRLNGTVMDNQWSFSKAN